MSQKVRIGILVSGGGTNLQALINAQKSGIIANGEIVVVISNKPGVYALQRAADNQIPSAVVSSAKVDTQEFENAVLKILKEFQVDLVVLAGFMSILSPDFIAQYPNRILNIHPSLIPSFCGKGYYGLRVHKAALAYGVKVTGATVHFVNEIPDGGKILLQKPVAIQPDDTPETLQRRVMEQAEWIILPQAVEQVCQAIVGKDELK